MIPFMNLMSGCFGGYGSFGMSPGTMGTMMNIWSIAGLQTAMQCGMPGIFGSMGVTPYTNNQRVTTNVPLENQSAAALKTQMDAAYAEYEQYINLCSKISEYEADTTTKAADLKAAVTNAEQNLLNKDKDLSRLLSELKNLQGNPLLDVKNKSKLTLEQQTELNNLNVQIQAKQKEIKDAEAEKAAAQKALEKAKQNLDAFNIAKSEDKKLKEEIFAKKEEAYKRYTELSKAYTSALAREASQEAVIQDRAADSREAGKWWNRTVINPENWFNKKGGLWGADKSTPDANIAKCLRKLKKDGRAEALKYAQEQGLITFTDGVASTKYSELQGLVNLYNGKDEIAPDPLAS